MTIENLVISGGGPLGFSFFSCLCYLKEKKYWYLENIKSIYATSVGTIISIILLLNFENEIIYNYFINRPWKEAFKLNGIQILDTFNKKGLFDDNFIIIIFKSLFDAKNINIDITMLDFYNIFKVKLNFYTFDLNNFETIELNYEKYPNLKLIEAIKMSCAFPGIIIPTFNFLENKCLIDGGILDNFPLNYCLRDINNLNSILAINQDNENQNENQNLIIQNNSNIIDFIIAFFINSINYINYLKNKIEKENIIYIFSSIKIIYFKNKYSKINLWINCLNSSEFRKELIDDGIKIAKDFLLKLNYNNENKEN